MKYFIKIDEDGEIITLIETSRPSSMDEKAYFPIKDEKLWSKIKPKPYNFRFKNGKLVEKSSEGQKLEEEKRKVVPSGSSEGQKVQDLETRIDRIEKLLKVLMLK